MRKWFKMTDKKPTDMSSNKYEEDSQRSDKIEKPSNKAELSSIKSGSDDSSSQKSAAEDKDDANSSPKTDSQSSPKKDAQSSPTKSEKEDDSKPESSEKDGKNYMVEVPLNEEKSSKAEEASEKISDIISLEGEGPEYTFDEVIDIVGYGWFQTRLTMLAGMGWLADAFEIIILSLIGEYLACEWTLHQWEIAFLTSTVFFGMMFGAPIFGILADKYGRRVALAVSLFFLFLFGASSAASPNYPTLVVLRAIMGFSLGGIAQGVTLCSEYYPAKNRGTAGFYLTYFWAIGTELLLLVAWLIMRNVEQQNGWQWLLFAASLPSLIVLILIHWYPESIRYYLVTQQYEKAVKQLNVLVKMNRATLPPGVLKRGDDQAAEERKGSILDLLKPPHTATTLLLWYIWFAVAYHYYGLVLITPIVLKNGKVIMSPPELAKMFKTNATTTEEFFMAKLPCTQFTNQNYIDLAIASFAEVPGLLAFTILVQFLERKKLLALSGFINTVLVLLMLVQFSATWPVKVLLFISRANICGLFQLTFIMTSEIFPTTLRAVGMGSGSGFARIGGVVVPFATQGLILNNPKATIILMSVVILFCAIAALFLPHEMKDRHMKDFTKDFRKEKEQKA